MKLAILLALGASVFSAYSVSNISKTGDNQYRAEVNIVRDASDALPPGVHEYVGLTTTGCTHVPGAGASAIVLTSPNGVEVQFSDGGTCAVQNVTTIVEKEGVGVGEK